MDRDEHHLLEEGPLERFKGATLQIKQDQTSRSPSTCGGLSPENKASKSKGTLCPMPVGELEAREYFSSRDSLVNSAIDECVRLFINPELDGDLLGAWLLTEISLWDTEKERLVFLTCHSLMIVKYDFITTRPLEHQKVSLSCVDTVVVGELIYPPGSMVPRLNGLANGVMSVVKGCLLRPLQERWASSEDAEENLNHQHSSPFEFVNFEARPRNVRGVRAMWNKGEPLPFTKRWNPFTNEVPLCTYTSHPLLWHKGNNEGNTRFDVESFAERLTFALDQTSVNNGNPPCKIDYQPIVLQNYVGIGSLIHNRNALGFFKSRGKFSF
ncbi:tumor protein p63-regulated gene 1-like protein isoform X1 [Neocloeon triangulifer]|uniref:tumor protein p63-regulated gene 1-like protein isoform X1 n=1 Tax=Neocloeon triangulifer TaxID=2078957 RepID=UPI00286F2909|nr:tumor protein p63-regulated gene 1-like protein isoform X1 [Neocloeon triangulifer]